MKRFLIIIVTLMLLVSQAFASTVVSTTTGITISNVNASYTSPAPITIWSIKFYPSNAADHVTIKLTNAAGQIITVLRNSGGTDPVIEYFPPNFRVTLFYDHAASTITTPANARIVILYRN